MAYQMDVTELLNYVKENTNELAVRTATNADSIKYFNIQTGVIAPTNIHALTTEIEIQDGANCGFNPLGSSKISHRQLVPSIMKVDAEWCSADFFGTCLNYQTSVAMGKGEIPYHEVMINDIIANLRKQNEYNMWSGSEADGDLMDGLTTIIAADSNVDSYTSTKTTVLERVQEMYANVNDEDYEIFCSMALYRQLVMDLINANYFLFKTEDNADNTIVLPSTSLKIHGIEGIDNSNTNLYGLHTSDMYVGVDAQGDSEKFDLWFSNDARTYRMQIKYALAVNYLFSDRVHVYGI